MPFAKTQNGKLLAGLWPTEGDGPTLFSPDWTDPCTWYHQSTRVVDEVAADTGDQLTYQLPGWSASRCIVDVYHGKISEEDNLLDGRHSYRVEVKVDRGGGPIARTEQDPHFGSGGDFTVDYDAGTITFLSALGVSDVVTVTYHYVDRSAGDGTASLWVLKPAPGKILQIKSSEVQFSSDIVLTDSVEFSVWGLVDVFAPQLLDTATPPGPYPSGTLIELRKQAYKTMRDYYNEANGTYPQMPALGGAGWRGLQTATNTFPWVYQTLTDLSSAAGMEIRIRLLHDAPFGGEYATATFYCLSVDES